MASDEVHHVGDTVAMVVADTAVQARDAAEAISMTWEDLPAIVDTEAAIAPGAPIVFAGAPGNVAYDTHIGDKEKTDAIFSTAPRTVRIKIVNPRAVANYMEPRSAVGEFDPATGRFTLNVGSQGFHGLQRVIADAILKIPRRISASSRPTLAAGSGSSSSSSGNIRLFWRRRRLGRSVAWMADRTEHFVGDAQGRDNVTTAEMALDSDGRFLALRVDILGNLGGYLSMFGPYIPYLGASMATGPYHIGELHARVRGVYTHTVPTDAYRGAGRPEAAYVLERLVEACARSLGVASEELRALNFIKPEQMPYHTHTNRDYDVGEFEAAMRACLKKADRAGFAQRAQKRARARQSPRVRHIELYRMHGMGRPRDGLRDAGQERRLHGADRHAVQRSGNETAYAQVVVHLDVPLERVRVVQGDTDRIPTGLGTGGSRSIPVGAVMVNLASQALVASLKDLAADKLEAAVADLEIADGKVRIAGTDRAISYAEIAALPAATEAKLKAIESASEAQGDLPERHAYLRGRDRSGNRGDHDRWLHHRRRFRRHGESGAACRPGAWRRRSGRRPGAVRGHCLWRGWAALDGKLHGLCGAARR